MELTVVATNLMLVLYSYVLGFLERSARSRLGVVVCLTAVGLGQEVGVKAVRNVVGILRVVVGSCHVRTRSAEEWNPMV